MAWITKDSAGAKVERREEPYFTGEMKRRMREVYLPRYEKAQGALLPALHMVQHAEGWIPKQALMEIAEFLGLTPADVIDTASFYEEFWLKAKGRHVVAVCRSIACEFCGNRAVTEAVSKHLGVDPGETTDDEEFTLVELECLGSCGTAPVMLIDEVLHENVDPQEAPGLVEAVRGKPAGH